MTATVSSGSFEQRLDNSPITRAMGLLWLLSAGLIALDGVDFFVIGVALPFLKRDFSLDATTLGAVATAAVVGSLTLGPITDRVGRKPMLIVDVVICGLAAVLTDRFRIETTGQSLEAVQAWERSQSAPLSLTLPPQGG